ncbi:tripartite tricarboxylate transporter substrate binding protein [Siccirubricoccus sp. G192]|uniref:Bug family tripartite tricarboxylate transporter substrate binding protein n=1 Tax=Siccirubricoccus sp. G192 TaxID=2849651 RepID=UPI001C2B91C9|nr:tripartite tricarboxylate transporter substrate binding protein [Siccirubricoccus sp. G192]MBV1797308.1 tripartite tricarboxylate transporter substrate binding protein [Siccirubricoccus sp. G192]
MQRRHVTAAMIALLGGAGAMAQEAFPNRPVRLVVGFPPGAAVDLGARLLGRALQGPLGQPVVVENRPGAASGIAAEQTARAVPDGHAIFTANVANAINAVLQPNPGFELLRDLLPVAGVGQVPNILVAHPSLNLRSVADLVAAARARPDGIFFGSSGIGTSPHLSGELFNQMAGVRLSHVPYQGSPQAVTDLLAGRVGVMFSPASSVRGAIESGRLVGLASTAAARSAAALDLPTIAESGFPGFESSVWFGLMVPSGTPAPIIARLARLVQEALTGSELAAQFAEQGIDPLPLGPDAFGRFIAAEMRKWAEVVQAAGLRAK